MTVYVQHTWTGEKRALFRPFGECVGVALLTLGIDDHASYSPDFKAGLSRDRGVWFWEEDANGETTRGLKP